MQGVDELRDMLATLREAGVTSAEFSDDGDLIKVTFGALPPPKQSASEAPEPAGPKLPPAPEEDPESLRDVLQLPTEMVGDPSWTPDDEVAS